MLEKCQLKKSLRLLLYTISKQLSAGASLSSVLKLYPHSFNSLICELIYLGEQTGHLDDMMKKATEYLDKQISFRNQVKQAAFYPLLILFAAISLTVSMLIFVVPHFASLFSEKQIHLPLLTRLLITISNWLRSNGFLFLFISITFITSIYFIKRRSPNRFNMIASIYNHSIILKYFSNKFLLARFTQTLSLTCQAGIPLADALTITSRLTYPYHFNCHLRALHNMVLKGMPLYRSMENIPLFTPLMTQMVRIGEETGDLESMLRYISQEQQHEIDRLIQQLSQLVEPLIMAVLGVLIGGIVIGLYLPVFQLGHVL